MPEENVRRNRNTEGGSMTTREAGKKGVETLREERGPNAMSEVGRMGGEARKQELGPEGYSELGHKGGQRVKELIEEGKRTEEE
jgi:general stress protein YciG